MNLQEIMDLIGELFPDSDYGPTMLHVDLRGKCYVIRESRHDVGYYMPLLNAVSIDDMCNQLTRLKEKHGQKNVK